MLGLQCFSGSHEAVSSGLMRLAPDGPPTVGKNIRRERLRAGFKAQKAFAAAVGKPQSRVSDWETDRYGMPDLDTLVLISKTVKCSIDDLLVGVDPAYDAVAGRDLIWHGGQASSGAAEASAHATPPDPARLLELERIEARHRETVQALEGVIEQLVKLTGLEDGATTAATAGSRRHHRTRHR